MPTESIWMNKRSKKLWTLKRTATINDIMHAFIHRTNKRLERSSGKWITVAELHEKYERVDA